MQLDQYIISLGIIISILQIKKYSFDRRVIIERGTMDMLYTYRFIRCSVLCHLQKSY